MFVREYDVIYTSSLFISFDTKLNLKSAISKSSFSKTPGIKNLLVRREETKLMPLVVAVVKDNNSQVSPILEWNNNPVSESYLILIT